MAGEDQERFEDYLELERYIEDLQAGRVAHPPEGLTPDQARIYRMATLFHAASIEEAGPRPEFVAGLQAKLEQVQEEKTKGVSTTKSRPFFSKRPQTGPHVSRRALLTGGAAAAVAAASLSIGVGIDHVAEERRITALTTPPTWKEDLVPAAIDSCGKMRTANTIARVMAASSLNMERPTTLPPLCAIPGLCHAWRRGSMRQATSLCASPRFLLLLPPHCKQAMFPGDLDDRKS